MSLRPCLARPVLTSLAVAALPVLLHAAPPPTLPADRAAQIAINEPALRAAVRFLADDALGGRGPGSVGDRLARTYLASQFESMGLWPAGDPEDGKPTYFQSVQLVGMRSRLQAAPVFRATATSLPVSINVAPAEAVLVTGEQTPTSEVRDAELVFVGYGITAPEYKWDDFKGVDLRGKVLVVMNDDPASDPQLFAGKMRLYYGRWDYKFKEAARHGAAGALIIHTTPSAGYPWSVVRSSWDGEEFDVPQQAGDGEPRLPLRGWLTEDASRRVARAGGQDLDALRAAAERRDFRPVPLGVRMTARIATEIRRLQSANVLAYLPGTDPVLRGQAVVYTAHHDHLGTRPEITKGPDAIYNGALDNATGCAGLLAIARAATLGPVPRRALLFAAVAGEEAGLLGSQYLVSHPPASLKKLIADLNIDGLNIFGKSPNVVQIGRGKSSLDAVVDEIARTQRRKVLPDQMPEKGSFYRSDQFNFARAGIPAIYLGAPVDLYGPDGRLQPGAGRAKVEHFVAENYHRPSDELRDDWVFGGAVQDVQLLYLAGLRIANAPQPPRYSAKDEFAR